MEVETFVLSNIINLPQNHNRLVDLTTKRLMEVTATLTLNRRNWHCLPSVSVVREKPSLTLLETNWHHLPSARALRSSGSFSRLSFFSSSSSLSQCAPVVPPDLPDILFPLLPHLVQMVRLYGVVCQSPFGHLDVTAGLMAREGPPTSPAHGHWHFSKGARMCASHPAGGGKWRNLELTQSPPQAKRVRDGGNKGKEKLEIKRLGKDLEKG